MASPERSKRWYAIFVAIIVGFAVYGAATSNWSFALAMLVAGGAYFLVRNRTAPLHRMRIENGGFLLDDDFTSWDDCKDYWILRLPLYTELHIAKKKTLSPDTVIQTGPIGPDELRETLSEFLSERSGQPEGLSRALIRILKL